VNKVETAPVIFLNFNRPEKTRASLACIREAKPREFFVFADGPRDGNLEDQEKCTEVRRILTSEVDWECKMWRYFPDKNMGCGTGVASAISIAFNYFEHLIILEDDCIASPDFFKNSTRLLAEFAHDETIGAINGNNFQDGISRGREHYYRSKYFHCWGWATWKRVWKLYDFAMTSWNFSEKHQFWADGCFSAEEIRFWSRVFTMMTSVSRADTWDYQFTYALFSNSLDCLTPNKNLVRNIGFGPDATHTRLPSPLADLKNETLNLNEVLPTLEVQLLADQYTFWKLFAGEEQIKCAQVIEGLKAIETSRNNGDIQGALTACSTLKSLVRLPGVDMCRAELFLSLGSTADAIQSLREEIRWYPGNRRCRQVLSGFGNDPGITQLGDDDFKSIYGSVAQYTMCSAESLYSLYRIAREVCELDEPGDFVECGVAAGGSTLLLGLVIQKYSKRERHLYSFDTFEGMPPPTDRDINIRGVPAQATHWGQGTCSSPIEYVDQLCRKFGIDKYVRLNKGIFRETLPPFRLSNPEIVLLHVDGAWYESIIDILTNLYKQMRSRGWIQIHDYEHWTGCKAAVDEFFIKNNVIAEMEVIDYTGRLFRVPGRSDVGLEFGAYVNVGCGASFAPGWRNFDIVPTSPDVAAFDIRHGIPMADESAEVVYSSHFIEHLTRSEADRFLSDCHRILKPGGIIRLVFPDLEKIARAYLEQLEKATYGNQGDAVNHDWMTVELIDQVARHNSGGEMIKFLSSVPPENLAFIEQRVGSWVRMVPRGLVDPVQESPEMVGQFRLSGEVHRWMYDTVSIKRLLRRFGFIEARTMGPTASRVPFFHQFKLDSLDGKTARKPDSSFVEAIKRVRPLQPAGDYVSEVRKTPSCFSTIATRGVLNDLRALLASLSWCMKGARIYIFSDTFTAEHFTDMPFGVELDIRWVICLDQFTELNRGQMEQMGLWSDFQLMKPRSMLHAFGNGEIDVMFLDADIFLMRPITLDDYGGQAVSLSRHHILKQMERMYGEFNGGTIWTSNPEIVRFWMNRFPESRYYDQACLEDVYEGFDCHVMHEGQNISPYRIYRAPENAATVVERFSTANGDLTYKNIPVQFIHTHLGYKDGIFGAFNELVGNLVNTLPGDKRAAMINFFRNFV